MEGRILPGSVGMACCL